MLNQAWTKKDAAQIAAHVVALSTRFNAVALWVAVQIMNGKTPAARAVRIEYFIELCDVSLREGFLLYVRDSMLSSENLDELATAYP